MEHDPPSGCFQNSRNNSIIIVAAGFSLKKKCDDGGGNRDASIISGATAAWLHYPASVAVAIAFSHATQLPIRALRILSNKNIEGSQKRFFEKTTKIINPNEAIKLINDIAWSNKILER